MCLFELDSSQRCAVKGEEATDTSCNRGISYQVLGRICHEGLVKHWNRLPRQTETSDLGSFLHCVPSYLL